MAKKKAAGFNREKFTAEIEGYSYGYKEALASFFKHAEKEMEKDEAIRPVVLRIAEGLGADIEADRVVVEKTYNEFMAKAAKAGK